MVRKPNGYWTKERCVVEAKKYNNKKMFIKLSNGAYDACKRNKWMEEATKHMISVYKPNGYWTKERCVVEAKKYNNRSEFHKNGKGAYCACSRNKWMKEATNHMKQKGNYYKRMVYMYYFKDKTVYIGLTYNIKKRNISHLSNKKSQVYKYFKKTGLISQLICLSDYIDIDHAIVLEELYIKYFSQHYNILNVAKAGGVGNTKKKWTKERCIEEARKYNTKIELSKNNNSVFVIGCRNKWLNEMTSHMVLNKKPNGYWTKEKCLAEGNKHNTRSQFKLHAPSAYRKSIKNKWLDKIFC